jgi:hypothetical protein
MAKDSADNPAAAKRLIGALLRMPPKPHEDMKLGKPRNPAHTAPKAQPKKKAKPNR